ncbi:MAG TPA: DNA topoisomerase IV subunit A, partial [Azospirillaceae bacterium]|nr:DNA topoisomerase IV subunit A [Azospirillaceae bacterium]
AATRRIAGGQPAGSSAAAMRYTEARLTEVAKALLEGIDENAVDFRATYDGDGDEPMVLPANFPNLLANGATGIAVGMATSIPPHNVGEICDALTRLIKQPDIDAAALTEIIPGPDFPTGGVLVESRANVLEAYRTGRGAFRLRARWVVEKLAQGTWQIIVTEIPYQVQKSRLVEKIAELLTAKKLILLEDVRDESADDIRLVLVPKSRNVDPDVLMASLFQSTDLETRFPLNMNVLDKDNVPRVMPLKQVLQAFLDHRHEVLIRRSRYRVERIDHRLEVLGGHLIAYLNLDEVIRIIREEDEPKPALMARFDLTDVQAEAILNMRLRNLRKLEEMEIRKEHDALSAERAGLAELLGDEALRWKRLSKEVAEIKKKFGSGALGLRRTLVGDAPAVLDVPVEAVIEREPLTVICSEKGWIRALRGHLGEGELAEVKYKDGDGPGFATHCETTDKLLIFASNGKFFTLAADKPPRGRGFGEPLRLMVDMGNDVGVVALFKHRPGGKLLVASDDGRGFVVEETEALAQTRAGRQVLTLEEGRVAAACVPAEGDHVAIIGNNRKMAVFPLDQVPVMGRGKGVALQKYKDGRLADVKVFALADGLTWLSGGRTFTVKDLTGWLGPRASAGRMPPNGFPKSNRFAG